jgi:hypothetical protein
MRRLITSTLKLFSCSLLMIGLPVVASSQTCDDSNHKRGSFTMSDLNTDKECLNPAEQKATLLQAKRVSKDRCEKQTKPPCCQWKNTFQAGPPARGGMACQIFKLKNNQISPRGITCYAQASSHCCITECTDENDCVPITCPTPAPTSSPSRTPPAQNQ